MTDGDARFDLDVGGMSWFQYPARRFAGVSGGDYYKSRKGYGGTGKGAQQRLLATNRSYADALPQLNRLDVDVMTFECASNNCMDIEAIGRVITDKKIAIGVVDHRNLQVERPEEVAETVRRALRYIPAERLILTSDCGFGREGMSRRIAFYKMVSIVRGANIVRRELGYPEATCLAADGRYALADEETETPAVAGARP